MELTSIKSFVSISEIAQLPLIFCISFLCDRAIKVLGIKEFLWLAFAFGANLLYIIFTILSDDKSPFYPLINVDQNYLFRISRILNLATPFFFNLSFVLWFTNKRYNNKKKFEKYRLPKIMSFILGPRLRAFSGLIILTAIVVFISIQAGFNKENSLLNWSSTIYHIVGLLLALLFIRWNSQKYFATKYLTFGFIIWALLQFLIPLKGFIGESWMSVLGFSLSLIAKMLLLIGIFRWCVDFTGDAQREVAREQLEKEQFQKSSKILNNILAETFHEINSPMNDLEKNIETLSKNLTRENRFHIKKLESEFERIKAVVRISKSSYDQEENYFEEVEENIMYPSVGMKISNINVLIEAAANTTKRFYKNNDLRIEFVRDYSAKCFIKCYPTRIIQLFFNLFKNSVEAYKDDETRKVVISTYVSKETNNEVQKFVVIEVEDFGQGIDPEIKERIWQAGYSTKTKEKNSIRGQGLSVVRKVIDQHENSTIELESPIKKGENNSIQGTKFIIQFPKYELIK